MNHLPPHWTPEQFEQEAARGLETFRADRLDEAREDYVSYFNEARSRVEDLLELTTDLLNVKDVGQQVVTSYLESFRYIAAPPVSEDDLSSLSSVERRLFEAIYGWPQIVQTVMALVDGQRFPWLIENRTPTEKEKYAAVVSTSAQIAAQRIATARRNQAKKDQEARVSEALLDCGFVEVKTRTIKTARSAPSAGEFCGESMLGTRKADLVVGLWDERILAIECKVSNSKVNSVKRVNNDAAVKARIWTQEFGTQLIVPAAVIAGVYNPPNLTTAQDAGLSIWWSHDLEKMTDWITCTK